MDDKAYLVVYTGRCSSIVLNGIKFTDSIRTAPVSSEAVKSFQAADGTPLYDDIDIQVIEKSDIVPDDQKEVTAESLKQGNTLAQLQEMARSRELDESGSKTELAQRIIDFDNKVE